MSVEQKTILIEAIETCDSENRWRASRKLPLQRIDAIEVPYAPTAWLKRPLSSAERKRFCRAAARLHDAGLVRGYAGDKASRLIVIMLTPAGEVEARKLSRGVST